MLIKCPQCKLVYEIDDTLMTDKGLKMHCQHCDNMFTSYPEDSLPQDSETQKNDVAEMFERTYGDNIEDLFAPELGNLPKTKIRIVRSVIYKNTVNWFLILLILALISALLYCLRYDVVRYLPNAEKIYQKFGVETVQNGEQLHLEHISTEEFVSDNISKIRIKGILSNPSKYTLNILPIKVTIFDKNRQKLSETIHHTPQKRTYPYFKIPFEIVLMNPNPEQKNIQITFTNQTKGE